MSALFTSMPAGIEYWAPIGVLALCILLERYWWSEYFKSRPYPPGPPMKPIIGNILEVISQEAWIKFTEYKKQYGDLLFFRGLGNNVLVLNSLKAMNDLLDGQATNYSHRPRFVMAGELMGIEQSTPLLQYGEEWRAHRKLAHIAMSAKACQRYHPMLEDLAALLGEMLLKTPEDFISHVGLTAGRIIMSITYGLTTDVADRDFIHLTEKNLVRLNKAMVPGTYLCDMIPILKYAPSWVPFRREGIIARTIANEVTTKPIEYVKREMATGTARPSLTQDLLDTENATADAAQLEHRVKWLAGSLFGAGSETTGTTVQVFILAMAMNPEKQRLAQVEIDQIVGTGRLPTISDRPHLPYVNALIKETMRWHPVTPLSVARRSAEEAMYQGYLIPKSTVVIPNVWAIAFEPNEKYDPHAFIPERFLDPIQSIPDPATWAFGFSRRICPGRFLAESSIFILISTILAAFDIAAPSDEEIKPTFTPHLVSIPEPFRCIIKPRSDARSALVKARAAQSTL
ncbi:cytochrome P450 [Amylocystis lapponica]|nr:cytochrome P450 [Amylocystis lapponica]